MRFLIIFLVLLLVILQYKLWLQNGGILDTLHLKTKVAQQEQDDQQLYERNEKLVKQINYVRNGNKTVEALAREQIGMVKRGETYYQLVSDDNNKKGNNR